MSTYKSPFISLDRAIKQLGGHEELIAALQDGVLGAQARYWHEDKYDAGDHERLQPSVWHDWRFDIRTCNLSRVNARDEEAPLQEAYISIRIEKKDFDNVFSHGRRRHKAKSHESRAEIEAELERIIDDGVPELFENMTALRDCLIERYKQKTGKEAADPSNVRKWLKAREADWKHLIKGDPDRP